MQGEKVGYSAMLTHATSQMVREEILPELFRIVREEIEEEWKRSSPEDKDKREQVYFELHAFNRVELRIKIILDSILMNEAR